MENTDKIADIMSCPVIKKGQLLNYCPILGESPFPGKYVKANRKKISLFSSCFFCDFDFELHCKMVKENQIGIVSRFFLILDLQSGLDLSFTGSPEIYQRY